MFRTRFATPADAALIGQQRRQMFVDAGQPDDDRMTAMLERFIPWVQAQLAEDRYVGWLVSVIDTASKEDTPSGEEPIIGGAGMWLMEFPPHFLQIEPMRPYLLNFYVDPRYRGRGLARSLLGASIDEARRRGCEVVTLHASKFGRALYEQTGFKQTNEMMLRFDTAAPDRTRA